MRKIISAFLLFIFSFCSLSSLFALPGFVPYIQELPGQYVYYQDKTFERESYFGLLQFTQNSFAARYYAPLDAKNKKPETEVEIYFTINEKADHMELTGERIMSGFTPEEAEIVNYLHDMIYELSARRIKVGTLSENKTVVRTSEYFGQFGGYVTVEYDAIIPLFNVRQVFMEEGVPDLFIVTAGQITGKSDKSFENFKGFPSRLEDTKHKMPKIKKLQAESFLAGENASVTLDSNWSKSMDNGFILGDAAFVVISTIPYAPIDFAARQLMLSTGDTYLNWNTLNVKKDDKNIKIEGFFYQPSTKNVSKNFKFATKTADDKYDFFTMTVYNNIYEKNRNYFNQIIKNNTSFTNIK